MTGDRRWRNRVRQKAFNGFHLQTSRPCRFRTHPTREGSRSPEQDVARFRPNDLKAPNHNDVRAFVHAWFAAFDHVDAGEFFLGHLDDGV